MTTRFRINRPQLESWINSADIGTAMEQKANKGKAWGEANSPVETGSYQRSWSVEQVKSDYPTPRSAARIVNNSEHAAAVEFGNTRNGGNPQSIVLKAGLEART